MDKRLQFFAYLIESYARHKGIEAAHALASWDEHGITDFIYSMYEMYHQEAIENAYADIDSLLATGKPAWQTSSLTPASP